MSQFIVRSVTAKSQGLRCIIRHYALNVRVNDPESLIRQKGIPIDSKAASETEPKVFKKYFKIVPRRIMELSEVLKIHMPLIVGLVGLTRCSN